MPLTSPQVELTGTKFNYSGSYSLWTPSDTTNWGGGSETLEVGVSWDTQADIFASYKSPTFWVNRLDQDWMIWNPSVFLEASAYGAVTIKLLYAHLTFKLDFVGLRFTPLDLTWGWDLDKKKRRCSSWGLYQEILDIRLEASSYVNECYVGLAGALLGSSSDSANLLTCGWRRYNPELPVRQFTLLD